MKKKYLSILLIFLLLISLVACGNDDSEVEEPIEKVEDEPIEEEESIKDTAIEADFIEINGKEEANGMRVFAEGEISNVDYDNVMDVLPSFLLSQKEGDGYGMYHITNAISLEGLEDGDIVIIYGLVDGTSDSGMPRIIATIIEPKE